MLHLVIMAGGSGTRFWPESRRAHPKQFLTLAGNQSLIQQAARRCRPMIAPQQTWVVTGAAHGGETRRQLPEIPASQIILEPCGRNTAPCIGLAAMAIAQRDPGATILVTPADHLIRPEDSFRETVASAETLVSERPDASVLIGITPTAPATGYGYIERGQKSGCAFRVDRFREKPSRDTAEEFLRTGRFYWNSGIFVWKAARLLELLREHQPTIGAILGRLEPVWSKPAWGQAFAEEFPRMPSISIDYAVLEPAAANRADDAGVYVLPATFEWNDVGSWQSLPDVLGRDENGNTTNGPSGSLDTTGCVIRTTDEHLVATIGLKDFVVVHTPDATLVAPRDDENALRRLVALLEEQGFARYL